ncbi:hypothetical protein [Nonomuraea longicatena]|uniref:Aminoacyl-transfer RNA synthetases class-II family profile domain-containing protein n=1 Tax=Nonomuraea longicatena TaxID=83682 RepID=A0ABP4AIN4_9ACTN
MTVRVELPENCAPAQVRAIADRLVYSVEGITGIEVTISPPALSVTHDGWPDDDEVGQVVRELADEALSARVSEPKVVRRHEPASSRPPWPDRDGFARARPLLHRAFDALFLELARGAGATERQLPALIDLRVMERCRYVDLFPQNAYLVDELAHHRPHLARLRDGTTTVDDLRRSSPYMLNPALCFHVYDEYADTALDGLSVVTAAGGCFRHEAPWRLDAFRLPSFTMREIVFLGGKAEVEDIRNTLLDQVWRLYLDLGLHGRVETATDPFYYVEDSAIRQHQLLAKVKYELVGHRPGGGQSAIVSFNNVRDSLCRQFGIRDAAGRTAHSGCVAFGVDRWVELTLESFGPHPRDWPEAIGKHCPS